MESSTVLHSGKWMVLWDDRLLEIIQHEGSGSPKKLSQWEEIRVTKAHVSRRLSKLADHDMLKHLGNGVYVITDVGEAYLDAECDAEAGVYFDGPSNSGELPMKSMNET